MQISESGILIELSLSLRVPSGWPQAVAALDAVREGPFWVGAFRVGLRQVGLQLRGADEGAAAQAAHVEEEVLADVGHEGGHAGGGVVAEQAGVGPQRAVHQQVALSLQVVLEAAATGGAVVQQLPLSLTGLQPGNAPQIRLKVQHVYCHKDDNDTCTVKN